MLTGTYNQSQKVITAIVKDDVYTVDSTHPYFDAILNAYRDDDEVLFLEYYNKTTSPEVQEIKNTVENNKNFEFVDGKLMFNGKEVKHSYVQRIYQQKKDGFSVDHMVKFLENLYQNPSAKSIEELPDFHENKNLPITSDGCFLAYKCVTNDFYSKTAGDIELIQGSIKNRRIYNAPGEVIECERREVDDDRDNQCSYGLHVGGLQYSGPNGSFYSTGDRVVICKINPKDVVSVPKDHNAQKIRVCKYEVIKEYIKPLPNTVVGANRVSESTINVYSPKKFDSITFLYQGNKDSQPVRRYALVEDVFDDYLFCVLLPEDMHYEDGQETRQFKKEKITNVSLFTSKVEDDDYDDDYDDEDDYYDNYCVNYL